MPAKFPRLFTGSAFALIFSSVDLPASEPIDEIRLLDAIAQVETGTKNTNRPCRRIGARGERTAWQIMPATWASYCTIPFARAGTEARVDGLVALAHLRALRSALFAGGHKPNPYALALAWNAGASAVMADRAPTASRDYPVEKYDTPTTAGAVDEADPVTYQNPSDGDANLYARVHTWERAVRLGGHAVTFTHQAGITPRNIVAKKIAKKLVELKGDCELKGPWRGGHPNTTRSTTANRWPTPLRAMHCRTRAASTRAEACE